MARARNIKPSFFTNELLGESDPLNSLLFIGLWVLADRDGRLEDRPIRIRASVFPLRSGVDVESHLQWLHDNGFIVRYEIKGKKYIQIENFVKHQQPHYKEVASTIPPIQGRRNVGSTLSQRRVNVEPSSADVDLTSSQRRVELESTKALHDPLIPESLQSESLQSESPSLIPESLASERFREVWQKWIEHRKEIKAPLKPKQVEGQLRKLALEGESSAIARIERSIANGWRGLWFDGEASAKPKSSDLGQRAASTYEQFVNRGKT